MITCICSTCGKTDVYEDHKSAWMDGWDFVGTKKKCGNCPSDELMILNLDKLTITDKNDNQ